MTACLFALIESLYRHLILAVDLLLVEHPHTVPTFQSSSYRTGLNLSQTLLILLLLASC